MVKTLLRSSLREIRGSMGRFLAIMAIVGLGVGFFAGLRMSQPNMIATGRSYLDEQRFHDIRLLSTLGWTQEDVDAFGGLLDVEAAGSVYTEFLCRGEENDTVLIAHMLTDGVNTPRLTAGRMPEKGDECLADARTFPASALGTAIRVSDANDEDTLELLAYDEYTVVGLADSPLYINYERGTSSIGSGSISSFVLLPEDGFEFEAYYEIFLRLSGAPYAYTDGYTDFIDARKPDLESLAEERGQLRYDDIYAEAMEEIADGEQELADGWAEYRSERADAEQELADAYEELTDGEQEYLDGVADYEQGLLDYADGLAEIADAEQEIAEAEQELRDGWIEYEDGKAEAEQELADAYEKLTDGEKEYADGLAEYEDGLAELRDAEQQIVDGEAALKEADAELDDAEAELRAAKEQLDGVKAQLEAGEANYSQLSGLYAAGQAMAAGFGAGSVSELFAMADANPMIYAMLDGALQAEGSSLEEFRRSWNMADAMLGGLTEKSLAALRAQLDAGAAEYEAGLRAYEEGYAAYDDACLQVARNEEKLKKARKELEEGKEELLDAQQELADARQELDDGWIEYEDGKAEAEQELADAHQKLLDGEAELADGKQELLDGKAELADAKRDLDDAPGELADARKELDDGWQEYYDGLAEAEQEFADAEQELRDGEQEIADAYEELVDLEAAEVFVLTRSENNGYACFDNDTSIVAAISLVFPVFFFLVAALVCMTTMKRMVDEQRTQIGVLKALGYSNRQVMGKFLLYSGSGAVIGSSVGYALGSTLLPLIIWEVYGIMYGFAPLELHFDPGLAAISMGAALLCSMGATWLSCRAELRRSAAELIRPKAPKAGRRVFLEYITPIWKHLGFLQKVSVRNVLRYRSRLIMMMVGIGGCTALLVAGFGLRDSLSSVMDDQFEQITLFDYSVSFRDALTQEEVEAWLSEVGKNSSQGLLVHSGSTDIVTDGGTKTVFLTIAAGNRLDGFVDLHEGDRAIAYPSPGSVVINRGLADALSLSVGESVRLRDEELGEMTVTVSDICDNFVGNYVYVSAADWENQMGAAPEYKSVLVLADEGEDPYAGGVTLASHDDVISVQVNEVTRVQVGNILDRLNLLVVIVVICAGALAFIVLYNLTNINITERIREIATIKVLGFYQKETAAYVFREIRILSVLGALVGLPLGKALHAFVMAQVQVEGMFFPCYILPLSYFISFALTMVFTVVITWAMRARLKRVDMAESLKSIE